MSLRYDSRHDEGLTYGGWRKTRGLGFFGLSEVASFVMLATVVVALILASVSIRAFFSFVPLGALIMGVLVFRWRGETLGLKGKRAFRWWWGVQSGFNIYRAADSVERTGRIHLPSVLGPTRMVPVRHRHNREQDYGLVHDQRTGLLTATIRVDSRSTWLAEGRQADIWVANWHGWLASLGNIPMVAWVAVTVETAPDPGATLAEQVERRIDPQAPEPAVRLLRQLVGSLPTSAVEVQTRVSITFDPQRALVPLKRFDDQVAEVDRLLVGLESSLAECGAAVLGRATPVELAGVLRTAYDPLARGDVRRVLSAPSELVDQSVLQWETSGPLGIDEGWREMRHDSGWSVSWGWEEAPRQMVMSSCLVPLLGPAAWPKRVTMLYRPLSAEEAAGELEKQVNASVIREMVRQKQGRDETARDRNDREQASQAAREEALGAGVVRMSMYVTTTVMDVEELAGACADIESRARQSRIELRRLVGSQMAGFAATLPAGIHPIHAAKRSRR
ncbi:MAG: SCO6880 family protein [Actinomycetota bacterium]